jgi:hypothetical protein
VLADNALSANCPGPWRRWITGRHYDALTSPRIGYRSRAEQLPADPVGRQILERMLAHFAAKPTRFEYCAAQLWQMADGHVGSYEVTGASVDGGRDAANTASGLPPIRWPSHSRWRQGFTTRPAAESVSPRSPA